MKRKINDIEYDLIIKKVKNINLRVKNDKSVVVSANRYVDKAFIDQFVLSHLNWIERAQSRADTVKNNSFTDFDYDAVYADLMPFCEMAYEKYKNYLTKMPEIKIKSLKSAWGICHFKKGYISLNANLYNKPDRAKRYVVFHEFNHFLVHDHSQKFYDKLYEFLPTWKEDKKSLIQKG